MSYASLEQEGQKIWILGSTPRHFYSTTQILNRLDSISPTAICVTSMHPTSSLDYLHYNESSQCEDPQLPYTDSDLLIKQKFFEFFDNHYSKNLYFFNDDSGNFFLAEPTTKTVFNDDGLSAANWAYLEKNCGLVAAGAHPFMVHEDLIHSIPLKRMREVFHLVVEEFTRRSKALGAEPLTQPVDLYHRLHNIVKADYIDEFYL